MNRFAFLFATLIVIAVNAAANLIPINGVNTGELSARYPTGFTPAGWVFAIWSLIYAGLLALSIWAVRADAPQAQRLDRIRGAYLLSCAANAGWILVWHYQRILSSLVVMLVLLASLVVVYVRLRGRPARSIGEKLCVDLPISLYLGWITSATIVNLAAWFFDRGAYPFGLQMDQWALVSVTLATAVYVGVGTLTRDPLYVAVFAWASFGIVYQTLPVSEPVRVVAAAACTIVTLLTVALLFGRRRRDAAMARVAAACVATLLAGATTPAETAGTRVLPLQQVIAKYADADSRFVEIDDVKLHYKDQGAGPAVLLIHGSSGDLGDWDGWVKVLLAKGWRVVRLDLPGFGISGPVINGNYSIDRMQSLVDGLMDEIGIERFAIVGTSYGGPVAFRYAATRTDRVTGLVIMNSAGVEYGKQEVDPKTGEKKFYAASVSDTVSREATAEGLRKAFIDPSKLTDAWIDRKVDFSNIVGRDREAALSIDQYVRGNPERVLGHVRAPVLVFWGGANRSLSQETADRFHAAVTRAAHREKVVQPGGGHLMHVELPEPTGATVAAFLEKRVRPGAPAVTAAPPSGRR
jgi:pimeloyl-ACP methyl ester carboxylesterase